MSIPVPFGFFFMKKISSFILPLALVAGISLAPSPARAVGAVPTEVQKAIDDSVATIQALSPVALSALGVALIPMGSFLALAFMQKIFSRV